MELNPRRTNTMMNLHQSVNRRVAGSNPARGAKTTLVVLAASGWLLWKRGPSLTLGASGSESSPRSQLIQVVLASYGLSPVTPQLATLVASGGESSQPGSQRLNLCRPRSDRIAFQLAGGDRPPMVRRRTRSSEVL